MASSKEVTVPAKDRAVLVGPAKAGECWTFAAEGEWRDLWRKCGPEGYRSFLFHALDAWPRLWNAPYFCLVGILDDDPSTMFRIGAGAQVTMPRDGALHVFANDMPAMYWNNRGAIRLTATRRDGPCDDAPPARGAEAERPSRWLLFRDVLDRTQGVLLIAVLTVLVGWALAALPQGRDLVRSVSEGGFGLQQIMFGLTLLFLALQAWFWTRIIINYQYSSQRANWPMPRLLKWFPRVIGFIPFPFVMYAAVRSQGANWLIALLIALAAGAFFAFVIKRQDMQAAVVPPQLPHRPPFKIGGHWVGLGLVVGFASFFVVTLWPVQPARVLGPPGVVFVGVGLLIPSLAILSQAGVGRRIPMLGLLLGAAALFSLWMDNHAVGRRVGTAVAPSGAEQVYLETAYADWARHARRNADGTFQPMILVAAEGGASRAGFWTGEVLAALHRDTGGAFADNLFAISSVSGGSVGAVGYVAALQEHRTRPIDLEARVQDLTGADALSPTLAGMLFPDLLQRFLPIALPFLPDRAESLERSWELTWKRGCLPDRPCRPELLSGPFLDIWAGNTKAWTPLVIVNGASEETGRPILTSPVRLRRSEVNADDFHTTTLSEVAGSTAIHNGARFPYISPAGAVRRGSEKRGHIIDGGYFDPAGTEVIRQLAHAIKDGPGRADYEAGRLQFVFVFIGYAGENTGVGAAASRPGPTAAPTLTHGLANELLAPPIGMLQSRAAHGAHLMRNLKADVARDGLEINPFAYAAGPNPGAALAGRYVPILLCDDPLNRPPRFLQAKFEMPMDWALSDHAKTVMRNAMGFGGKNQPCSADPLRHVVEVFATLQPPGPVAQPAAVAAQ